MGTFFLGLLLVSSRGRLGDKTVDWLSRDEGSSISWKFFTATSIDDLELIMVGETKHLGNNLQYHKKNLSLDSERTTSTQYIWNNCNK